MALFTRYESAYFRRQQSTVPPGRLLDAILGAAFAPAVLTAAFVLCVVILNVVWGGPAGAHTLSLVLLFGLSAFVVASAHAVILGLPAALSLQRLGWANAATALSAGFLIGSVPVGLGLFGSTPTSLTVADGPFLSAQLKTAGIAGLCGAVGGLTALIILRGGTRTAWAWTSALGAATVGLALVAADPWAMVDRSCHNPARDGRNSIGPEVIAGLRLESNEWPALADAFEGFAQSARWSFRDSMRSDPPILRLSVCSEEGTQIQTMEMGAPRSDSLRDIGVLIFTYQPQGGVTWEAQTQRLIETIEERWPGRLIFIDRYSGEIPPPDFLTRGGG